MDYVLGSVAALVTGNVTPNRPKLLKRALTPTKHQPSPNVTPKSEFVEDRSIFLSPSMQKKKAIVKKSPKRIFQNPDPENTENGEGNLSLTSPKADKVKKHLKDELEADGVANLSTSSQKSPKKKGKNNKRESASTQENNKSVSEQEDNESTPKKKKKKQNSESDTTENVSTLSTNNVSTENNAAATKSPKKKKQRSKSVTDTDITKENDTSVKSNASTPNKSPKKQENKSNSSDTPEKSNVTETSNTNTPKKKNKKRKKKPKAQVATTENKDKESSAEIDKENNQKDNQVAIKKKNKKRKKSKGPQNKPEIMETDETKAAESDSEEENTETISPVNSNAITDKESDSEHESDDEIESENEEINKKVFEAEKAEESSDEDDEEAQKHQKVEKKDVEKKEGGEERMTEDEIKRTLFVGNVPFSAKVKKELKKIFNKHGQIETIRIRTVPIKDGRYTPKLAVIKNELHPERTTVNVYIKYADEESVEKALVENNTVLNGNHLRVSRSSSTGAEHDPKCSVFIGNLPFAMEDEALRAKFEKCGEIHSVRIIRDKKTNAGKGFGYVNFESKDGVELALALSEEDLTVKNRILRVKRCTLTTNKKKPVKNNDGVQHSGYKGGNHQPNQQSGGYNNQASQQRGGFNNQQRGGFNNQQRGGFNNQQRGGFRGNNQGQQQGGGFRSSNNDNNQQRGGFRPGNQQRSGPPSRNNQGNRQRAFGDRNDQQRGGFNNNFGGQRNQPQKDEQGREGAHRRVMNKRKNQDAAGGDAPPNKKQKDTNEPNKEKKVRKEFVGMTAEKKKKRKVDKGQKKKKALSEILTK